jgi:hypothetical protein
MNNCKALRDTSIVSFTIHGVLCSRFVDFFLTAVSNPLSIELHFIFSYAFFGILPHARKESMQGKQGHYL